MVLLFGCRKEWLSRHKTGVKVTRLASNEMDNNGSAGRLYRADRVEYNRPHARLKHDKTR